MSTAARKWLAMSEADREVIREKVRAQRVAQGLPPGPDPARLALTLARIERLEQKRAAS